MSLQIPKILKKEFKEGFFEYIKEMGRDITVCMTPYSVDCPNCIYDNVQKRSSNVYNTSFIRPLNAFPNTPFQKLIYPVPFNVSTVSGVQYDPTLIDPKILIASNCPVCLGAGSITYDNRICIKAVVTWNYTQVGVEGAKFVDLAPGRDGKQLVRLKTYDYNYALCRDAIYFIVDGVKVEIATPAKLKGLGAKHITEVFLITVTVDNSSDTSYDNDSRTLITELGNESNQASVSTPTVPPSIPGDDVW